MLTTRRLIASARWVNPAVQALVAAVTPIPMPSTEIVQTVGGISDRASFVTAQELVREFTGRLGASYRYLHAPAAFTTAAAREA